MGIDKIIDDLVQFGFSADSEFIPISILQALHDEAHQRLTQFQNAQIGKKGEELLRSDIRNDKTLWFERASLSSAQSDYWGMVDELRSSINAALYLNLRNFECHYAYYEAGGFYQKHLDQFANTGHRKITTLSYLNRAWDTNWGGQLLIYDPANPEQVIKQVEPIISTFVCFLSEQIYHEVLPSKAPRLSIAGWLRTQDIFS